MNWCIIWQTLWRSIWKLIQGIALITFAVVASFSLVAIGTWLDNHETVQRGIAYVFTLVAIVVTVAAIVKMVKEAHEEAKTRCGR